MKSKQTRDNSPLPATGGQPSAPCPPPPPANVDIRKILVPIDLADSSHRALEYALHFAERFQAGLVLLHVVEPLGVTRRLASSADDESGQQTLEEASQRLTELSRATIQNRVPAEVLVRMGRVHSEIADTANALNADLIIMDARKASRLDNRPAFTTTEKVIRYSSCPVLAVGLSRSVTSPPHPSLRSP